MNPSWLSLHLEQQQDDTCVAACTAMLFAWQGKQTSEAALCGAWAEPSRGGCSLTLAARALNGHLDLTGLSNTRVQLARIKAELAHDGALLLGDRDGGCLWPACSGSWPPDPLRTPSQLRLATLIRSSRALIGLTDRG